MWNDQYLEEPKHLKPESDGWTYRKPTEYPITVKVKECYRGSFYEIGKEYKVRKLYPDGDGRINYINKKNMLIAEWDVEVVTSDSNG